MDREEARRERNRTANPDPRDVPGFNRATGVDDPVPGAEYGDVQDGPDRPDPREQDGSPDEGDEVDHAVSIRDRAEQFHNEVHEVDSLDDTKFDCWGARAILRLAELEADRPARTHPITNTTPTPTNGQRRWLQPRASCFRQSLTPT